MLFLSNLGPGYVLYYGIFGGSLTQRSCLTLCLFNLSSPDKFLVINSDQNLNSVSRKKEGGFVSASMKLCCHLYQDLRNSVFFMVTSC